MTNRIDLANAGSVVPCRSFRIVWCAFLLHRPVDSSTGVVTTDVLIIGGGSAGCTLGARLAERHPNADITIVEAGGADRGRWDSWQIHMPAALTYNIGNPGHDWMYRTEPLPHLNNRRLAWPRGKVLGGSSSLNAMVYVPRRENNTIGSYDISSFMRPLG